MKHLFLILILFSAILVQADVRDLRAGAGIIIEWPNEVDSLLLLENGFELYDYTAESFYLIYDEYDVIIDTGFIIIYLPPKGYDVDQNGSVNILDMTYWIFGVYKGGL